MYVNSAFFRALIENFINKYVNDDIGKQHDRGKRAEKEMVRASDLI